VLAEFFRAVSWIFSENGRSEKIFPSFWLRQNVDSQ
jgi:hypothetical protein